MNWEVISAVAEVVGAAGVILTLVYVAAQIRQNTRAIRGATLNAITQHMQYENRWGAEIGPSFRKAMHDPAAMDEEDVDRIIAGGTFDSPGALQRVAALGHGE